jgi:hypothetical protein
MIFFDWAPNGFSLIRVSCESSFVGCGNEMGCKFVMMVVLRLEESYIWFEYCV